MPEVIVRQAKPADAATLAALIRDLAVHEGKQAVDHITPDTVASWAFRDEPAFYALLATISAQPAGYLAYYPVFSCFKGGRVLLVENIYVANFARGFGVGRRLMAAAAREAVAQGYARLELNVRAESIETRAFYECCGLCAPGELVYRVEDADLRRLAESAGGEAKQKTQRAHD